MPLDFEEDKEKMKKYIASNAQARMYVINKRNPNSLAYNVSFQISITGKINDTLLYSSIKKVFCANEILHANFGDEGGVIYYTINQDNDVEIEKWNIEEINKDGVEEWLLQRKKDFVRPFNMKKGKLYRIAVCEIDKLHRIVVFDFHHSVFDGNCIEILCQQIKMCYEKKQIHCSVGYHEFVNWQEKNRKRDTYYIAEEYWKQSWEDEEIPVIKLGNSYTMDGEKKEARLVSREIQFVDSISECCKKIKCTDFSFFAACIDLLLFQLTGEKDIVIGTVTKENKQKMYEKEIGMFVNTFPLKSNVDSQLTIAAFIQNVHMESRKALKNSSVQFDRIVELIKKEKSDKSIFNMLYRFQKKTMSAFHLRNAECVVQEILPYQVDYEMNFYINKANKGYEVFLNYEKEAFEKEYIDKVIDTFVRIVDNCTKYVDERIDSIEWVSSFEKKRILCEFNKPITCCSGKNIIEVFEEWVEKTPNNIAVKYGNEYLTYLELNNLANQLAVKLIQKGMNISDRVAIHMDRSLELIVAIYGVLKAGGVYIPISFEYPEERISYIINDSKAKFIISDYSDEQFSLPVINLEGCVESKNQYEKNLKVNIELDSLVSVIYTSGTTGKPKGVMNKHRGLINLFDFMQKKYSLQNTDVILQKTSITFDVAGTEFFWWSQVGASVILLEREAEREPYKIIESIEKNKITVINFVPSMLNVFLDGLSNNMKKLVSIRYVFAAGEALSVSISNKFYKLFDINKTRLVNLYGPTEASIYATYYDVCENENQISIGKPIDNTNIVVCKGKILCGIDEPGELCIIGESLAEGYVNDINLTEAKFVKSIFGNQKMYRTGDVAVWRNNGMLQYLGRIDEQVKIRGFRIELGDIQNAMLRMNGIKEAVAIIRENSLDDKTLNVYYTASSEVKPEDMRDHLKEILPYYMVPTYLMQIDKIPTTFNGKLSKRELPQIDMMCGNEYIPPRSREEKLLCDFLGIMLDHVKVGIKDSFIELGGDSIKAVRVSTALAEKGMNISVSDIMSLQTPEKIAREARGKESQEVGHNIEKTNKKDFYDMSFKQVQIYTACMLDASGLTYSMPHAYWIEGELDVTKLKDAYESVVNKYQIVKLCFGIKNNRFAQWFDMNKKEELIVQYAGDDSDVNAIITNFIQPFDLEKDILVRAKVIIYEKKWLFLIDMHHLISDGISYMLFFNDIIDVYNGQNLGVCDLDYIDYCECIKVSKYDREEMYWRNILAKMPKSLDFPTNHPRSNKHEYRGESVICEMEKELVEKVICFSKESTLTEYIVLVGAFILLLARYADKRDIVIGTSMHGRQNRDTQDMFGLFVNTVLLRVILQENVSIANYLELVRETVFDAIDNQEYPLERITSISNSYDRTSKNPLFDIMFTYQNYDDADKCFQKCCMKEVQIESFSAKFDYEFEVKKYKESFFLRIEYNCGLYNKEFMNNILHEYCIILSEVIKSKDENSYSIESVLEKKLLYEGVLYNNQYQKEANRIETQQIKRNVDQVFLGVFSNIMNRPVESDDNFYEIGGDSIKAIRIASKLKTMGYELSVADILEKKLIYEIASCIKKGTIEIKYTQKEVTGKVLLSPMQNSFFHNFKFIRPEHYNQSILVRVDEINGYAIKKALKALAIHHDALRMICRNNELEILSVKESKLYSFSEVTLRDLSEDCDIDYIIKDSAILYENVDLLNGPFMNCKLYKMLEKCYLLISIHHLVIDEISWNIFLEDLKEAYLQAIDNKRIKLPAKTASFAEWTQIVHKQKEMGITSEEKQYWENIAEMTKQYNPNITKNSVYKCSYDVVLDHEKTNELIELCSRSSGVEVQVILLTALVMSLSTFFKCPKIPIAIEGHGREKLFQDIDINRTIGWFTSVYPVIFDKCDNVMEGIESVRESLRQVPQKGLNYGILRLEDSEKYILPQICFNYLGITDVDTYYNPFFVVGRSVGNPISKENDEGYCLEFNIQIWDGKLVLNCVYSKELFLHNDIVTILDLFSNQIYEMITYSIDKGMLNDTRYEIEKNDIVEEDYKKIVSAYWGYDIEKIYKLAPLQLGMMYHHLAEENWNYFIQEIYSVPTDFSCEMLNQIMELIMLRYDALRTVFVYRGVSIPYQVVLSKVEEKISELYMEEDEDIDVFIDKYNYQERCKGFDLAKDSLWRVTLVQNSKGIKKMLWSYHHIIADGWSSSIIYNTFLEIYEQLNSGISFEDVYRNIVLERRDSSDFNVYITWVYSQNKEKSLAYWDGILNEYHESVNIPSFRKIERNEGEEQVGVEEIRIEASLYTEIRNICVQEGITLNTFVETIWGITLQVYNRVNDVVFGKVVSGRNAEIPNVEEMVGLLINTLPVRMDNRENLSFTDLAKSMQRQSIEGLKYGYCSLSEIQKRTEVGNGLVNTIVDFVNYYTSEGNGEYKKKIRLDRYREQTNYDISFVAYGEENLSLKILYNPCKYSASDIQFVLIRIKNFMSQVVNNPKLKVDDLDYAWPEERKLLYNSFVKTENKVNDFTINQMFDICVKEYADEVALICQSRRVTYKQLGEQVDSLTYYLKKIGNIKGTLVPIVASKSEKLIVAIFAVLKAGASFVPIDPSMPQKRIDYIIQNSKCQTVLTDHIENFKEIKLGQSINVVELNDENMCKKQGKLENTKVKPYDLAYVIYTSGTTGTPKGVMVEHRSLVNYLEHARENYVGKGISVPLFTNPSFDLTLTSIFLPLCYGGTLYIYNNNDYDNIERVFKNSELTLIKLTPSHLNIALACSNIPLAMGLQTLILGGEELDVSIAEKAHMKFGRHIKIHNEYGPTEATIGCMDYIYNSEIDTFGQVPIGKPIRNTKIYIVNNGKMCGVGMPGELCIAGECVARGYWDNTQLTEEKFRYNSELNEILYHTGDLAVYSSASTIEFCGRIGDQIKIRGHRVELGEIESTLREIEGIRDAVVILQQSVQKYLSAFVVTDNKMVDEEEIKEQLRKTLPEYMIPNYIVKIDKMPITKNGKIDRKGFPKIERERKGQLILPVTKEEKIVVNAFQKILGIEKLGILDNFYELGGDSIKAIQIMSELRENGYEISIKEILARINIGELSRCIKPLTHIAEQGQIVGDVLLTSIQKWFFANGYKKQNYWNQSVVLRCQEKILPNKLKESIEYLVQHHDALRMKYSINNDQVQQTIVEETIVEINEFYVGEGDDVRKEMHKIHSRLNREIDIENGKLIAVGLVNDTINGNNAIIIVIHHLVVDGVSWRIIIQDLEDIYSQITLGQKVKLPFKTDSYKHWAEFLFDYSQGSMIKGQMNYWKNIQLQVREASIWKVRENLRKKDLSTFECNLEAVYTDFIMKKIHKIYKTEMNDIVLAAFSLAIMELPV